IQKTLHIALDHGVKGVMFSTHPMIYEITDMMRRDARLRDGMGIYVNLPYIFKYVRMASEMGMVRSVKTTLAGRSLWGNLSFMAAGARGVLMNDYLSLADRLIDIEMNPFHGLKVKAVFLHNALTDLALAYGMSDVFKNFHSYVAKEYGAIPAFGTLNLPALDALLARTSMPPTLIMASVNKNGFLMNPSRLSCERTIAETKHTVLAMGTLASGTLAPDAAYEYIAALPKVRHVVVGVSTKEHAGETFSAVRKHLA
ncbi:hypothetical protein KW797_04130, partial [Candidatus Parcubacteria bacterium]|nr:hypothetical protein [Candidatus Parcubacteria bacterium]